MKTKFFLTLFCTSLLLLISCEKNPTAISPLRSFQWAVSQPESQGLNSSPLNQAVSAAKNLRFVNSLLVVRNGFIVSESYFNGYGLNDAHNVMSVSKSFISALVGLALEHGYLNSLDQKMLDFFPEYDFTGLDARKKNITIAHLLTLRAGFDNSIEDYEENWKQWISSPDWVRFAIEWPLTNYPGTHFAYITAEVHLLSAILTKCTGMSTKKFAQTYLFEPLNISVRKWKRDPKGYYIGGFEMYFTPRDMARFGYLYLNNGKVDGRQIVPEEWVQKSILYHSGGTGSWGELQDYGYGYLWWLGQLGGKSAFLALGYGGQYIIIFPELNLIVVTTSNPDFDKYQADAHERAVLEIVTGHILPAVMD